jgi:hypothetical protein
MLDALLYVLQVIVVCAVVWAIGVQLRDRLYWMFRDADNARRDLQRAWRWLTRRR